jgi:hypothetical protein
VANGGLTQQGYPISEEIEERSDIDGKTYSVQYFERAVFELHPENQPPYDVLLQLLGVFRYREVYCYSDGAPFQRANVAPDGEMFPQTGKIIGGTFLEYWKKNGGLPQYGYPISDEFQERSPLNGKTYTVQYFERAVFELHPENQPPYDVLLSQLGTFRWQEKQESQKTPEFRSDIPDGQYIPLYPGALLTVVYEESFTHRLVWYEVPPETRRIEKFYEDTMPKYGWTSIDSIPSNQEYSWTDPQGNVPWHIYLSVGVSPISKEGRQSGIILSYSRYPDADKLPMFAGAEQIEVSAGEKKEFCSDSVTNTTYLVDATSESIESFYREVLPTHGWVVSTPSEGITSQTGLLFVSDHPLDFPNYLLMRLSITAQPASSNLARVVLKLNTCKRRISPLE